MSVVRLCAHEVWCGQLRIGRGRLERVLICDPDAGGCGRVMRSLEPAAERLNEPVGVKSERKVAA